MIRNSLRTVIANIGNVSNCAGTRGRDTTGRTVSEIVVAYVVECSLVNPHQQFVI